MVVGALLPVAAADAQNRWREPKAVNIAHQGGEDEFPSNTIYAFREAVEAVAILLSLVAPYTAEEMWSRLGHEPTVARAGWPEVDPALLVQDAVTAVVQIQGKVRARLEVSPDISEADLEALAMADEGVVRAIDGRPVRKVIVRAPKLVNIVV